MRKQRLLTTLAAMGAFDALRAWNRDRAIIAMFHRFGADDRDGRVPAGIFDAQVSYLCAHYRVVPLSELCGRLRTGGRDARALAAITIDDGYRDCHDVALPILRAHGAPATVFITTGFLDATCWIWTDKMRYLLARADAPLALSVAGIVVRLRGSSDAARLDAARVVNARLKTLPDTARETAIDRLAEQIGVALPRTPPDEEGPMTWAHVRALEASGVEIGAHTVTHPVLTQVPDSRLRRELHDARDRLASELGHTVGAFCYPNGDHDDAIRRAVEDAGYRCAVTVEAGLNSRRTDPLRLKRVHTELDLVHFMQGACGLEAAKLAIRRRVSLTFDSERDAGLLASGDAGR